MRPWSAVKVPVQPTITLIIIEYVMIVNAPFSLSCPLPELSFDRIMLGHGSGGSMTRQLLEEVIFPALDIQGEHDGAALEPFACRMAFTTDSFVVHPLFFPGGNIGDLAVNGTLNDLAMCGAQPRQLSLSFILEEGLPIADLWEILHAIRIAADRADIAIVTGDTKVVEKGKGDGVFINTSGIGTLLPEADIHPRRIRQGDRILLSGHMARHGITIMSQRQGLQFDAAVTSDTCNLFPLTHLLLETCGKDVHFMRDPTRGGVATVLNEAALSSGTGIHLLETALPLDSAVEGACEILGLDPLYVANEGLLLAVVTEAAAAEALAALQSHPDGRQAAIIGTVVAEHPGMVIMESRIGGKRVVSMLPGEQLPRIC